MKLESEIRVEAAMDRADGSMVASMRLLLSISALLTIFISAEGTTGVVGMTWLVISGYTLHSLTLFIGSRQARPFLQGRIVHWIDVAWYAMIVFLAGHSENLFFLFFFFAILTASFSWGFEEGARITMASAALFALTALVADSDAEIARRLLQTTFLLALGYMIAYWGESEVVQKRRLALLRSVSQLSNPRFGVDHTIATVLEKTRIFFKAGNCILLLQDLDSASWTLRMVMEGEANGSITAVQIGADAAAPLMAFPQDQIVAYTRPRWRAFQRSSHCLTHDNLEGGWIRQGNDANECLAELLDARSFISAPLTLKKGAGRIYVVSSRHGFSKADALFLSHIRAQAFPVIENIALLDRLASEAGLREREKIARDLHDTTIQPFVGLKHGLSALRSKAAPDNPLIEDLDKLTAMATQVIGDLRNFALTFKSGMAMSEPEFLGALRQQALQVRKFYGIEIEVSMEGSLNISDRLAAEVFQVVNEGMSNIRKHTSARHGSVRLNCAQGWLSILIENECQGTQAIRFTPLSISERTAALGGRTHVGRTRDGKTAVHIEIPV